MRLHIFGTFFIFIKTIWQFCNSTSYLLLIMYICQHLKNSNISQYYSFQMQLKSKLMLYKWLFNVNRWPYSPLLVYYLKFKCPLRASQETYGMYKYFYERFWMMGENNVPITLRKMSKFNTWKDLKMLKCLQNLQSFIFFIFGVEKLSENSITCLMKKQFDQCVGQILLKKGS